MAGWVAFVAIGVVSMDPAANRALSISGFVNGARKIDNARNLILLFDCAGRPTAEGFLRG
jgi:hypothetical protein